MKQKTPLLPLFVAFAAFSTPVTAQTFVFGSNSGGGQAQADLDDKASGSTIAGGLTLTAAANSGDFNSTSSGGFGINAAPTGDSTTEFDDGSTDGAEFMTFSFDEDVTFESIELSLFGTDDEAFLTIGANTITIDSGSYVFGPEVNLSANTDATFGFQAGNGFQLESISVVPEPATFAAIAGLLALGCAVIRRRSAK